MTAQGRLLDELAANATIAPVTRLVDGWLAKAAPGLPFRRASSVLPAPGAGTDPRATTAVLDELEPWYRSLGLRLLVQVSSADPAAADLDALLAARGAEIEAPVDVLVADIRQVTAAVGSGSRPQAATTITAGVSEEGATHLAAAHGDDAAARARTVTYGSMLAGLGPNALAGGVVMDGEVVGVGFAVLERGWAGIFGMATAPTWRRTGVAATLLSALATAAADRHGARLYLQVETGNEPARALYEGLGFTRDHGYHYRATGPAEPGQGC